MRRSRLRSQFCRPAAPHSRPPVFMLATSAVSDVPLRGNVEKVLQEQMTMLGSNAFRVKLHAVYGEVLVGEPHDQAAIGIRRRGEVLREARPLNHKRMIACGLEGRIDAAKNTGAVMMDFGKFAVDRGGRAHDFAAKRFANRLMAETNTEDGNFGGSGFDEVEANAGLFRRAWARRQDNSIGISGKYGRACDLIIAVDADLLAQFTEIVHQVEGKAVVIVDQ